MFSLFFSPLAIEDQQAKRAAVSKGCSLLTNQILERGFTVKQTVNPYGQHWVPYELPFRLPYTIGTNWWNV
jgi:hypothetical protein